MGQTLSREATSCSCNQEIPVILWNPEVRYRIHNSPPLVPILSHTNPVHVLPSYLCKNYSRIILPSTPTSCKWSLPSVFHQNPLCNHLLPIRAMCPAHLFRVYPITPRDARETYKSLSSALCSFLQFPLTSPLLGRNNFLGSRFSNSACVLLIWETRFHTHTKQQPKL
jgi:hypothetical protein